MSGDPSSKKIAPDASADGGSTSTSTYNHVLAQIRSAAEGFQALTRLPDDDDDEQRDKEANRNLFKAANALRDITDLSAEEQSLLTEAAEAVISKGIDYVYNGKGYPPDSIACFTHTQEDVVWIAGGKSESFRYNSCINESTALQLYSIMFSNSGTNSKTPSLSDMTSKFVRPAYNPSTKPSPHTTPLAYFFPFPERLRSLKAQLPLAESPALRNIREARVEIVRQSIPHPQNLAISPRYLAILGAAGWKERAPALSVFDIGKASPLDVAMSQRYVKTGFVDVAHEAIFDDGGTLWVGCSGDERIKAFEITPDDKDIKLRHTLKSSNAHGPLANIGDRLIRAGSGYAIAWHLSKLEAHDGDKHIGGKMGQPNTWMDEDEANRTAEWSVGEVHHSKLALEDGLEPEVWRAHPSEKNKLLVADDNRYIFRTLDINTGKITQRFIGHGGKVADIATNSEDPYGFVTAGVDGFVRLWDARQPLPVMTFGGHCAAAIGVEYAMTDGIPTLFSGGEKGEGIFAWCPRMRACLYELSTGNNWVSNLAWDSERSTLYASTLCTNMTRTGGHIDYERVPMGGTGPDRNDKVNWPKNTARSPGQFGHVWDQADHGLILYHFKDDADPDIVPASGGVMEGGTFGGFW